MRTSVQDQAVFAALAALLGFALGLVFDALRIPRAGRGIAGRAALDLGYALAVFTGLFLLGLRSGAGRSGPDAVLFAALGALLYAVTLSRLLRPVLRRVSDTLHKCVRILCSPLRKCEKKFKNIWKIAKKDFPKLRNCYKILYHRQIRSSDDGRTQTHENQTGRHHYEDHSSGDRPVRRGEARHDPR